MTKHPNVTAHILQYLLLTFFHSPSESCQETVCCCSKTNREAGKQTKGNTKRKGALGASATSPGL